MDTNTTDKETEGATVSPDCAESFGSAVLGQARKNLRKWGKQDLETLGLAISEETGELCQAILQHRDEKAARERIRAEVIDLGALCLQTIEYLDHPPCAKCDRGDGMLGHSEYCPKNDQSERCRYEA